MAGCALKHQTTTWCRAIDSSACVGSVLRGTRRAARRSSAMRCVLGAPAVRDSNKSATAAARKWRVHLCCMSLLSAGGAAVRLRARRRCAACETRSALDRSDSAQLTCTQLLCYCCAWRLACETDAASLCNCASQVREGIRPTVSIKLIGSLRCYVCSLAFSTTRHKWSPDVRTRIDAFAREMAACYFARLVASCSLTLTQTLPPVSLPQSGY